MSGDKAVIDAWDLDYRLLNRAIRRHVAEGAKEIIIKNVLGQRFIADGLEEKVKIIIEGVPGNDLGMLMSGPEIYVKGNAEDGVGNTMNDGKIVVNGGAGDITGYSMRGGRIYVRGSAGYRVGVHMKEYKERFPILIVGGSVRDFLGEYMAGGRIIVLGLDDGDEVVGRYVGSGMHGGRIIVRRRLDEGQLGMGAKIVEVNEEEWMGISNAIREFCMGFNLPIDDVMDRSSFAQVLPSSSRPYGKLYTIEERGRARPVTEG